MTAELTLGKSPTSRAPSGETRNVDAVIVRQVDNIIEPIGSCSNSIHPM